MVGLLRSTNINADYNVTHFGSVTISSYYLLDFSESLSTYDKINYAAGTLVSSVLPSSVVGEEFNIRKAIYEYADIPGGGWTPVYIFIVSGFGGVFITSLIFARIYFRVLKVLSFEYVPFLFAPLVIFISTCPRWFMYTPFQLLKMPLYGFVFTFFLFKVLRFFDDRSKEAVNASRKDKHLV